MFLVDAEPTKTVKVSLNWPVSKMYEAMGINGEEHSLFEVAYCENMMIQIY